MVYWSLVNDRRPLDIQALRDAGFFAPQTDGPAAKPAEEFGLDDFARETGIEEADLTPFFRELELALGRDPALLGQLNEIRQRLGLPPVRDASQAGLQDPSSMMGEDLMAMLIMWALQQQGERRGQTLGNLAGSNFSNTRPVGSSSWNGMSSSGGGGAGGPTGAHPELANLPTGQGSVGKFLEAALAQDGKNYVFGAEVDKNDTNPGAFDCSELVEWACAQAGINIPDGTMNQEPYLQAKGAQISLEQAINTPGALLYSDGHVAISLGDGRTIEAMNSGSGVRIGNAAGRFQRGYTIPGMSYG